ncbi:hypothetical protein QBC39DRAFT_333684 [Podospora conica]|nr:hypothetical protein QBC39DRAFT_333684 [Schizothecium conicum]
MAVALALPPMLTIDNADSPDSLPNVELGRRVPPVEAIKQAYNKFAHDGLMVYLSAQGRESPLLERAELQRAMDGHGGGGGGSDGGIGAPLMRDASNAWRLSGSRSITRDNAAASFYSVTQSAARYVGIPCKDMMALSRCDELKSERDAACMADITEAVLDWSCLTRKTVFGNPSGVSPLGPERNATCMSDISRAVPGWACQYVKSQFIGPWNHVSQYQLTGKKAGNPSGVSPLAAWPVEA